jgi:hypothetical protein
MTAKKDGQYGTVATINVAGVGAQSRSALVPVKKCASLARVVIGAQRLVVDGTAAAGQDTSRAQNLLDTMERHLTQLKA